MFFVALEIIATFIETVISAGSTRQRGEQLTVQPFAGVQIPPSLPSNPQMSDVQS
jgi:hypothetical protein